MERDLVIRAQHGDVEAFSTLTLGRSRRLGAMARLILHDEDRAADAVQDALLEAWRDLRGLRDPVRFDAWLRRILIRSCYRVAKRQRSIERMEIDVVGVDLPGGVDPPGDLANRDEIGRAFRRLTPEHRAVIVVRHYLDLSLAEAAEALDIPLGTVQSRLNRAHDAMRAELDADDRVTGAAREAMP